VVRAGPKTLTILWYAPYAGPTEGNRLWAAKPVVSYRKRTSHAACSIGCERDIDWATPTRGEARTAAIGLAEVGGHGNALDVQRRCAVIAQSDGHRRTGSTNTLAGESQASWRQRGIGSRSQTDTAQRKQMRTPGCVVRNRN